jgi:hypothetical protein
MPTLSQILVAYQSQQSSVTISGPDMAIAIGIVCAVSCILAAIMFTLNRGE